MNETAHESTGAAADRLVRLADGYLATQPIYVAVELRLADRACRRAAHGGRARR